MRNWLNPFLKNAGLSQEELGERVGKSRAQINRYANSITPIRPAVAEQLAPHLNTTAHDLVAASMGGDRGAVSPDVVESARVPDLHIFGGLGNGGEFEIEVFDNGAPTDSDQVRGYWSFPGYMVRALGNLQHIYAWEVRGDSMEPTLPGGSVVFVDTSQSQLPPDDIYAIDYGDGLMVKRVKLVPRSSLISVISDNEHYGTDDLARSEVRIYGRIVGWFQWRG